MLADYTKLVLYRTEHPEAYWKLFEMWLEWWRLDSLYGVDYESDEHLREHESEHRHALIVAKDKAPDCLFRQWVRGTV